MKLLIGIPLMGLTLCSVVPRLLIVYILCFLSFATVGLVIVSDGHRAARFRYGYHSVADS